MNVPQKPSYPHKAENALVPNSQQGGTFFGEWVDKQGEVVVIW